MDTPGTHRARQGRVLIVKMAAMQQGPVAAMAVLLAWTRPEEAAVHLVQGPRDRRVEGDTEEWMSIPKEGGEKGLQMSWPCMYQTMKRCRKCGHSLRVV